MSEDNSTTGEIAALTLDCMYSSSDLSSFFFFSFHPLVVVYTRLKRGRHGGGYSIAVLAIPDDVDAFWSCTD